MNQKPFNPMDPPCDRTPSEQIPMKGKDFVNMMTEIYQMLQGQISSRESLENKRGRIQLTGKLVWIVDRFVDIDFEGLKKIPYLKDGDHLMVLQDETHAGQCSIYKIYNTESVPNVRYLGYGEPDLYPSIPAVEQFVNHTISTEINRIQSDLDNANEAIASYQSKLESMEATIADMTQKITEMEKKISDGEAKFTEVDQKLADGESWITQLAGKMQDGEKEISSLKESDTMILSQIAETNKKVLTNEETLASTNSSLSGFREEQTSKNAALDYEVDKLTTNITAETTRATEAEKSLSDRVTTLESKG